MKNANISRLGGFTLIELLVVVLIIGILAAMAMPQYFKAVERSRATEAVALMDSVAKAQRRKFLQTNHYAEDFRGLDVSPKGATGDTYHTKGDPVTGAGGNGFRIELSSGSPFDRFNLGQVVAYREVNGNSNDASLQYKYVLFRSYQSDNISCQGDETAASEFCMEFCGTDEPAHYCCDNGTTDFCPNPTNN